MITIDDVRLAAETIRGGVVRTRCVHSRTLSELCGAQIYIKYENHQFTASFKERGALNKLISLSEAERARGVVAMSAGNHAQAVARHARALDIPATIVMPRHTPHVKVRNTAAFGARIILEGETVSEAGESAARLAESHGYCFIHPYDDERIMAGQGTIGIEMLEECPFLDQIIVPIGGGGLISGIAVAARALKPDVQVIGVQTTRFPAMRQALAGEPACFGNSTIAEGIAVKQPGRLTQAIVREQMNDIVLVDEPEIERAILLLLEIEKTVAEGAGAAALAAVLRAPDRFQGQRVGIVLSGGNIDLLPLSAVIERGLVRTQRVLRVRVGIPDIPGALADLTRLLADHNANVVQIAHQRAFTDLSIRSVEVEAVLETLGGDHIREVIQALSDNGYDAVVTDGAPHPDERNVRV